MGDARRRVTEWPVIPFSCEKIRSFMELPLKIFGIVFHPDIENMLEKSPGLHSFGAGVEVLADQENKPHDLAV